MNRTPIEKTPVQGLAVQLGPDTRISKEGIQFHSVSFVPAPQCSECRTLMESTSNSEWACFAEGCGQAGKPFVTGVYPVMAPGGSIPQSAPRYLSMGCRVDTLTCTLCEKEHTDGDPHNH
jgi:hypothetical protein